MPLTKVTNSMINGAFINVLDYGAVADGSWGGSAASGTDNLLAFQNACAAAVSTGISVVYAPGGQYYLSAGFELPRGITLTGNGSSHYPVYKTGTVRGTVLLIDGQVGADCIKFAENTGHTGLSELSVYNTNTNAIRSVVSVIGVLYPRLKNVEIASLLKTSGVGLYIKNSSVSPNYETLWGMFENIIVPGDGLVKWGLEIDGSTLANTFVGGQFAGYWGGLNIIGTNSRGNAFTDVKFDTNWDGTYVPAYVTSNVFGGSTTTCYIYPVISITGVSNATTFTGCYVEAGGAPANYNDGTHGSLPLYNVVWLGSTANYTNILGMSWNNTVGTYDLGVGNSFDSLSQTPGVIGQVYSTRKKPYIAGVPFSLATAVPDSTWTTPIFNNFGTTGPTQNLFTLINGGFKATHDGLYLVSCYVSLTGWAAAANQGAQLRSQGAITIYSEKIPSSGASNVITLNITAAILMTAGQDLYFEVWQNSGAPNAILEANQTRLIVSTLN